MILNKQLWFERRLIYIFSFSCQVKPLNERLREVRGAKMVVDVVQCSQNAPQLKRVVQFVCGNSLVCENLKDARHVAFDGPERLKVRFRCGHAYSACALARSNLKVIKWPLSVLIPSLNLTDDLCIKITLLFWNFLDRVFGRYLVLQVGGDLWWLCSSAL